MMSSAFDGDGWSWFMMLGLWWWLSGFIYDSGHKIVIAGPDLLSKSNDSGLLAFFMTLAYDGGCWALFLTMIYDGDG